MAVRKVNAYRRAPNRASLPPPPDFTRAVGRTQWSAPEGLLRGLPLCTDKTSSFLLSSVSGSFDLWIAAEALKLPPESDVILAFSVESPRDQDIVVGLGCDDTAILFLDGSGSFGTLGVRELVCNENLIPLRLHAGMNELSLLCQKVPGWRTIPFQHGRPEWGVSINIFRSNVAAWRAFRHHNFHVLDTPIVRGFEDIRVSSFTRSGELAQLYDLRGNMLTSGTVMSDGTVSWSGSCPSLPFVGMFSTERQSAEPLIVALESDLYLVQQNVTERAARRGACVEFWSNRVKHLLKPEFAANRDRWWARKLTLSVLMALTDQVENLPDEIRSGCLPTQIRIGSYTSDTDGTAQYFRFAKPFRTEKMTGIVFVIPAVGTNVRPFSEGAVMANLRESEDLTDVASQFGIAVVWPGLVDADYGGDFTISQLNECIQAVLHSFNDADSPVGLWGSCSSGVAAIGYAERHSVDGVVLETPMIRRGVTRWFPGVDLDYLEYPDEALCGEQTTDRIDSLRETPILLIYNRYIRGHGDMEASKWLCAQLGSPKGALQQRWPMPSNDVFWGESERMQMGPILEWFSEAFQSRRIGRVSLQNHGGTEKPCTVKAALLRGFAVSLPQDQRLEHWFSSWRSVWRQIRGSPWKRTSERPGCGTVVTGAVISPAELSSMLSDPAASVVESGLQTESEDPFRDEYWGFRILGGSAPTIVQVFRSPAAVADLPKIELLTDGCCTAAIWKRKHGIWSLSRFWRPN